MEVAVSADIDRLTIASEALGSLVKLQDSADKSWYKFEKEEVVVEREDSSRVFLSDQCPVVKALRSIQQWRLYADGKDSKQAGKILDELGAVKGDVNGD